MHKIKVISKKYDGRLRDEADAFLVARDSDTVVLLQPPGTLEYSARTQQWEAMTDGLLLLFFTNRWYNVWHIADQRSHFNRIYANIALPAHWLDDNTLEWIDLDLDIRVHMDGSLELLDEDEFLENQQRFAYPSQVVAQARAAAQAALDLCERQRYPFDYDIQVARYVANIRRLAQ